GVIRLSFTIHITCKAMRELTHPGKHHRVDAMVQGPRRPAVCGDGAVWLKACLWLLNGDKAYAVPCVRLHHVTHAVACHVARAKDDAALWQVNVTDPMLQHE